MTKWFVLIGVVIVICLVEWIREIVTFKVTHYNITSDKLKGLERERKVLFLTDLHNNLYGKQNKKLISAIQNENPDYIFIGGDMLVGKPNVSRKVALEFAQQIASICPVYYANGNHEQRMKLYPERFGNTYQEYKEELVAHEIHFLENNHVDMAWEHVEVQLHGLEIPAECYKKLQKTTLNAEQVSDCIGQADASKYQILLAHNPIFADAYLEWGADLVLSGHLHGGVVRIPGLGGIITPQFRLFPKYSGEYTKKGDKAVIVSKGLGTHTIKIRFLNPAEIVVLHIR